MSFVATRPGAFLCAIGAPVVWSVGGVIIRSVTASSWDIVFWRSLGHAVAFTIVLALYLGARAASDFRRAGWTNLASAVLLCGSFILHIQAMTNTTVANVLVLQSTSPLVVAVMAWLMLGERIGARGWIVLAIAFIGLAPVVGSSIGGGGFFGDCMALGVALVSAINVIVVRRAPSLNLLPATVLGAIISIGVALPFAAPLAASLHDIALMILLGILQMSVGLSLFLLALRVLPAAEVTLISLLEPVLGPIWVWMTVGEQPAALTLIGGAVVLAALAVNAALSLRESGRVAAVPA